MSSETKMTKKELVKYGLRYLVCSQACWNYESAQSCGGVYAVGPYLEKIYADDPELLKKKMLEHFQYFNTQSYFGAAIWAAALAIEETKTEDATEIAVALKTSMMGPFAGIGDALFNTLPKVVFAAMSAYAAIEGNFITGLVLLLLVTPFMFIARQLFINVAYYKGAEIVSERQEQLNNIREAISLMGVLIVGALIATTVKINIPLEITVGEATQSIQGIFDAILPNILSVLAVFAVYKGLDIKKMNTTRMVWVVIIIGLILSYFGIIG